MATVKEEIRRMIESLPEDATWEDVQYSTMFASGSNVAEAKLPTARSSMRTKSSGG